MVEPPVLISVLVFVSILLFCLGALFYIGQRQERWRFLDRIKRVRHEGEAEERPKAVPLRDYPLRVITAFGRLAKPNSEEELSHLRKAFLRAGIRKENASLIFFGLKVFFALLMLFLLFLTRLFIMRTIPSLQLTGLAILLALIGFYLPNLGLRLKIDARKEKLLQGLPDALDLMVVCAEAGVGLDAAINRVGEEMKLTNKPLSEEFRLLNLELRAGKQRRDALKNMAVRTDLDDIRSLVTLLVQTERFGTSIAQALRVHSDAMRTQRFQRAEEVAAKLPVKLLFPLILFIFPSLFVTILGPAVIRIYRVLLPTLGAH